MTGDKHRVVIVGSEPRTPRMDNSRRGLSIREHGKTHLAICGFLALIMFPISLVFNPAPGGEVPFHTLVAYWIGFITFFAFVKYIAGRASGVDEEATFLPTFIGATFCALIAIVGDRGTAGLLSLEGLVTAVCVLIILISTIAMALDRVWEPLMLFSAATVLLTWLAHVSDLTNPEAAVVPALILSSVGLLSGFAALMIALQRPDND